MLHIESLVLNANKFHTVLANDECLLKILN